MLAWKPKSSDPTVASVRYRCLRPLQGLRDKGFEVELFNVDRLSLYSAVIFSKLYDRANQSLARELRANGIKVILDICDNHLYNPFELPAYTAARANLLAMIQLADHVVCSTKALADILMSELSLRSTPFVVGDPLDDPFPGAIRQHSATHFKFLWFGIHGAPNAPCGMLDILNIADVLGSYGRRCDIELIVASNDYGKYADNIAPLPFPTSYREWNSASFSNLLQSVDAVLIPVTKNPFTICKTNNRLTLALNNSVPVIADSIPSYREFADYCFLDSWDYGLSSIIERSSEVAIKVEAGQKYVAEHWSLEAVSNKWLDVFASIA